MSFSKSFPRTLKGSTYPIWEEIQLTDSEEKEVEEQCRSENRRLFEECIKDASAIMKKENLKDYQTDLITPAKSLFDKRASHVVFWKESKAKEKFDEKFS